MPCAHHFRSIQRLGRFCTIQDDATSPYLRKMCIVHMLPRRGLPPRTQWMATIFLGLSCSAASCRTYGKHSRPVRHSTGPGRGGSELNSVRTTAGAPPPTSWKSAQCSGSQCAFFPVVSRHTKELLRPFYTMCRMGEAADSCEMSCCWGDGEKLAF